MHPAPAFRHDDPDWQDAFIRYVSFATIAGSAPGGVHIAHSPVVLCKDRMLRFHLARSNALVPHLENHSAVAVFNGPDAYISARWYTADNQVPTWNYMALECEGSVTRLPDEALPQFLEELSSEHEARQQHGVPWTMEKMDDAAMRALLRGIVGFELRIEIVRETVKLSQNKPVAERERLIEGLRAEGANDMADAMRDWTA